MPHYLDKLNGVSLSEAYAEAAASAPVNRAVIYTYELKHPTFSSRILIVNAFEDIDATLEDGTRGHFVACPVQIVPPEETDAGTTPTMQIRIDGVSAIVAERLDAATDAQEKIEIVERVYVSDDLSAPAHLPPLKLTLSTVSVSAQTVTGTARFSDPINIRFPAYDYLPAEYPSLAIR